MALNPKSEISIDEFNQQLRASPQYRAFLRSIGANPDGALRLSDRQRKQAADWVRQTFGDIGKLQVDPAGNVNQDQGWSKHKKWAIPAAIGAATLGMGAAGVGPASGLFGGGAGASGAGAAGGGVLASSNIPTALAMKAVPGVASTIGGGVAGAMSGAAGAAMPAFLGGGAATAGGAASAGKRIVDAIAGVGKKLIPDSPGEILGLASLLPLLANMGGGGGGNPFSDEERALYDEARQGMALQRKRFEQTQPVFDDLVRRTQAYAPNASYGGPAYEYRGPRFGG